MLSKLLNVIARGALAWLLLLAVGIGFTLLSAPSSVSLPAPTPAVAGQGWGAEALAAPTGAIDLAQLSPVALANACGLGASSCFKCHNGKRTAAPTTDAKHPWHLDHKAVNFSCAGCHAGNPRLIKQELAHKGLLVHPLTTPGQSCTSCHAGGEADRLLKHYQK